MDNHITPKTDQPQKIQKNSTLDPMAMAGLESLPDPMFTTKDNTDDLPTTSTYQTTGLPDPYGGGFARSLLCSALPEIPTTLNDLSTAARQATEASQAMTDLLKTLKDLLSSTPSLKNYVQKICDSIALLYDIVIAWLQKLYILIPTLLYRFFILFQIPSLVAKSASIRLSILFGPKEPNQGMQNMQTEANDISMIFSSLSSVAGLLFLSRSPSKDELRYVNDKLRFMDSFSRAGGNMGELVMKFVQHLPDVVKEWAQFVLPAKWWFDLFQPGSKYYQWMTEIEALDIQEIRCRASYDLELQTTIRRLHSEGQQLLKDCSIGPQFQKVFTLLRDKVKVIEELFDIVDVSALNKSLRPIPFCVYLTGKPGKGKTFLATILPPILACAKHDTPNLKYARSTGMDHWDRYTGQFAVVYDDFYCCKAQNANPGECAELISIISNEQYPLAMADLKDKGEVFRSSVVIVTSNTAFPAANDLMHPDALYRRRHAMYEVDVKRDYCDAATGVVDSARIPADNSHFVIKKYLNPADKFSHATFALDYKGFIADVVETHRLHVEQQKQSMTAALRMVAEAVETRQMQTEGKLMDFLEDRGVKAGILGAVWCGTAKFVPQWYRKMKELLDEEEPEWYPALMEALKIAAAVTAVGFLGKSLWDSYQRKELDATVDAGMKPVLAKMQRMIAQGKDFDDEKHIRSALGGFKTLIPTADFDRIVNDYLFKVNMLRTVHSERLETEGAYGATGKVALHGRPVIMAAQAGTIGRYEKRVLNPNLRTMETENSDDDNSLTVAKTQVAPAMVQVFVEHKNMQGIMIQGRICLLPRHAFLDRIGELQPEGVSVILKAAGVTFEDTFDYKRFRIIGTDMALYQFGILSRTWKDITRHFFTNQDLQGKDAFDALMITERAGLLTALNFRVKRLDYPVVVCNNNAEGRYGDDGLAIYGGYTVRENEGWCYTQPTDKGDCGAVLMALDTCFPRKICGVHVAGTKGHMGGCSLYVSQEQIMNGIRKLNPQLLGATPRGPFQMTTEGVALIPRGNFTIFGRLEKRLYQSRKTKIRPSLIHGRIFEPLTAPSVLDSRDSRMTVPGSPLLRGIEKYGMPAVLLEAPEVERVGQHISQLFMNWRPHMEPRIMTLDESINGVEGYAFADALVMDTSSGFPWCQRPRIRPGKLDLFEGEPGTYRIFDRDLRVLTDMRWNAALAGQRVPSLWIDCLKDERRTLEKVRAGKTRVFTIPPVDFSICFRRLTLAFSASFYQNALSFFSAVGVDAESFQWTQLYNRLAAVSTRGFAGDYSGYDGNLSPQLMMETCEIINRWYDDEPQYQMARRVMFDEIIHTPQASLNCVYQTHIGNPSGNPLTAIMNTIVGAMYLRMTWLKLAPPELRSLATYETKIADAIYGDDSVVTVAEDVQHFFNPENVSKVLNQMGMTFTATSKDRAADWENLENLTFLKRGFRRGDQKRWLPTMDINTIQELTNWIRESDFVTPEDMTVDNCNCALRFAFFHGFSYFDSLYRRLCRAYPPGAALFHDYAYYYGWFYEPNMVHMQTESNVVRDRVNAKGIISLSQREANEDDGSQAPMAGNRMLSSMAISDVNWTLPDMSKRAVWMATYDWNTADAFQAFVSVLQAPFEFLVSHMQTAPFERFLYWNGSMTVRIRVNGTRFHAGRLIAYFVPFTRKTAAIQWHGSHMAAAWSVPNVQLDASSNNVGVLNIPFYNPKSAIALAGTTNADHDYTGTFILQVLSPLTASSGTAPIISVNVWVEFNEDQEFRVPIHSGAVSSFNPSHRAQLRRHAMSQMHTEGNTNSQTITAYGNIDGMTVPTNMTGDSIGNGNSASGLPMDKPARAAQPIANYQRGFQTLCHTVGSETTTRLDLDPSQLNLCKSEMFGTMTDEMEFKEILTRPTYAGAFEWNASDTVGTVIQSRWMGPGSTYFQNKSQSQIAIQDTVTLVRPPTFDYVPMFYTYWRGSIKIRFDLVATQMHTGRLFLSANYGVPPDTDVNLRDATSQFGVEIDLSNECRTFVFEIKQNIPTVWMRVCRGPRDAVNEYTNDWFSAYFYGSWAMSVMNKLVAPDNVSPNISIMWSVAGGDDFELYYPGQYNVELLPNTVVTTPGGDDGDLTPEQMKELEEARRNMMTEGDEGGTDAVSVPTPVQSIADSGIAIAPEGSNIVFPHHHFGSKAAITHLGQLIKRYTAVIVEQNKPGFGYSPMGKIGGSGISDASVGFAQTDPGAVGPPPTGCSYLAFAYVNVQPYYYQAGTPMYRSAMHYFGSMYRFWRGSMRYKIIWDGVTDYKGTPLNWTVIGATFLPGILRRQTGLPNLASVAAFHANALTVEGTIGSAYPVNENASPFLAIDANTAQARYNDIEIPFTTRYNVMATVNGSITTAQQFEDFYSPGKLLVFGRFHYPGDAAAQLDLQNGGLLSFPTVLMAAGDEFRFGTFMGPPIVQPHNIFKSGATYDQSSPYDTWVLSPAPGIDKKEKGKTDENMKPKNKTVSESSAQSEEDGFIMTQSMREILKTATNTYKGRKAAQQMQTEAHVDLSYVLIASLFNEAFPVHHHGSTTKLHIEPNILARARRIYAGDTYSYEASFDDKVYASIIFHASVTPPDGKHSARTLIKAYEDLAKIFGPQLHWRGTTDIKESKVVWSIKLFERFDTERVFYIPNEHAMHMMDFVKLAAMVYLFETSHDRLSIRDPLEPLPDQTEMYFMTEGVPKDTEKQFTHLTARAMQTEAGDNEFIPPTTNNIIRILEEKQSDLKSGKTAQSAWNEFCQVIPVVSDEKDKRIGPDHEPKFYHTIKTRCDNRYWKEVIAQGNGLTKKAARENACHRLFSTLFEIYLVALSKGRLTPPPPIDSDDEPEQADGETWYKPGAKLDKILEEIEKKEKPSTKPKYQNEPNEHLNVKLLRIMKMIGDSKCGSVVEDFAIGGPIEAAFIEINIGTNVIIRRERSVLLNQSIWKVVLEMHRGLFNGTVETSRWTIPYHGTLTTASLDALIRSAFTSYFSDFFDRFGGVGAESTSIATMAKLLEKRMEEHPFPEESSQTGPS